MSEPLKDMQNTEEGDVTVTATPVAEPIEVEEAAPADNSDAEMDAVLDRILEAADQAFQAIRTQAAE